MDAQEGDVVMLMDSNQLRTLAKLLLNQEEPLMQKIKSEPEREKYLKDCNDAYNKAVGLVEDSDNIKKKYEGDKDKKTLAEEIHDYLKYGVNMSLQNIRNCSLRVSCIGKIKDHCDTLVTELAELDPNDVSKYRRLAKEVSSFKKGMWEYTNNCKSASSRALSKAYSMFLKQEGKKFPDLVESHKNKMGFEGEFGDLEEAQKLEVYNSIIEESGRAKIPKLEVASASIGVAVLVVSAGVMVWDIFTAEHKIEAVLSNSLNTLAEVGAFAVQVAVEAAVTEAVADVELGVFIVSLAGFVAGSVVGLLFVAASGALLDLIFGSGGKATPDMSSLKFHSAKMPDGMALAYEIAHDG